MLYVLTIGNEKHKIGDVLCFAQNLNKIRVSFDRLEIAKYQVSSVVKRLYKIEYSIADEIEVFDRIIIGQESMTTDHVTALLDHLIWENRGVQLTEQYDFELF